ncbi:hypothetical protein HK100_002615 [Physocladia obscura]|uniref:TauD/TfdA-like domain-containing protein n=1 Tax=Physocladia obscura TaxID=109957 RepID=A0AAD5XJZ0_9FUNG|nr:hypothetical protein HK100_002615 [Physocladia obscura]
MTVTYNKVLSVKAGPIDETWTKEEIRLEFLIDPTFQHHWVERQFKNAPKHRGQSLPPGFPEFIDRPSLDKTTFPLPESFRELTEVWLNKLLNGLGFLQIRGFKIDDYSKEDAIIAYAGLASYIGDKRLNQAFGQLGHITSNHSYAPNFQTVEQVFHTDTIAGGNVISFLAINAAETGGDSLMSSIGKVYNDIAKTRPDIIKVLADDWILDQILAAIARRPVTGYGILGRHKSLPQPTEEQKEALDTLHFLAAKYSVNIPISCGDIQFFNNYEVFHAREGYIDSKEHTCHLVRLTLHSSRIEWEQSDYLKGKEERFIQEGKEELWDFNPAAPKAKH